MLAHRLTVALLCLGVIAATGPEPLSAQAQPGRDCVTIGTPTPAVGYTYQHKESNGRVSEYTTYWEEVTATGSRHRTVLGNVVAVQVDQHHIEADVSVIDATTSSGADGHVISKTTFHPGVVGDPAFRACAGRSWPIPASTAVHSSAGMNASAQTPAGTLTIVAIREAVTVPAGRFDTVHYTRATMTPAGKSVDEYWKSIDHGVVVKHAATLPNGTVTEVLQSIR